MSWGLEAVVPPRRWLWLVLAAAIVALAAYLRLYHLGRPSFWHDEVFSLTIVDRPFWELWGLRKDVHPPLYYMLLHQWLGWVGYDEFALRLHSVLFSLATVPAIYLLGRRIGGVWLGLAATLCFAISPMSIEFAQELRAYSFLGCIAAWTLYGFARLVVAPERASLSVLRGDPLGWALVGAGSLLALYTHNLGLLLPFALTVVAVVLWWSRPERARLARNWTIVQGLVLLLWLPWLPELVHQVRHSSGYSWIPAPSAQGILQSQLSLAFGLRGFSHLWVWLAGLGFVALASVGAMALPRRPSWAAALLALFVLPALGSLAITFFFSPVYLTRTLIWSGIPILMLLGAGIVALLGRSRGPWLLLPAAALLLLALGNAAVLWDQLRGGKGKDDWRDVAIAVSALLGPDDAAIAPGLGGDPLAYYLARLSERSGKAVPRVLDLESGLPKSGKLLWRTPEPQRYLFVEVPWRHEAYGLRTLIAVRFPCHRLAGRSERSGMILWLYERDPACTPRVPGLDR